MGSVAVGRKFFFESVKARLSLWDKRRDIIQCAEGYLLRESPASYRLHFEAENEDIAHKNSVF
jgi:hypothetical protein